MDETKIIYYKPDDEKMPYLIKLNKSAESATLRDFKMSLNGNAKNYKFFFQTIVDDFGVVKEELMDDNQKLPSINGRVVSWLVQNDQNDEMTTKPLKNINNTLDKRSNISSGSSLNDSNDDNIENQRKATRHSGQIKQYLKIPKKNHSKMPPTNERRDHTDTESVIQALDEMRHRVSSLNIAPSTTTTTSKQQQQQRVQSFKSSHYGSSTAITNSKPHKHQQQNAEPNHYHNYKRSHFTNESNLSDFDDFTTTNDQSSQMSVDNRLVNRGGQGDNESIMSSDLDTTTFFDEENDENDDDDNDNDDDGDEYDDQMSSCTEDTIASNLIGSRKRYGHNRNRRRLKTHKNNYPKGNLGGFNSLHSSMTSLTESTMSLNIITVTLNMDTVNFLGISIVGQSNKGGEGGIYIGSIMNGGAVAQDGRIEPGDMILQVNETSFENMSNDDAVRVLREAVMKPG
jgi:hypothetical protein